MQVTISILKIIRVSVEKYIQRWVRNGIFSVSDYGHDHVDLLGIVIG